MEKVKNDNDKLNKYLKLTNQFTFSQSSLTKNEKRISKKDMRTKLLKSDRHTYNTNRITKAADGVKFVPITTNNVTSSIEDINFVSIDDIDLPPISFMSRDAFKIIKDDEPTKRIYSYDELFEDKDKTYKSKDSNEDLDIKSSTLNDAPTALTPTLPTLSNTQNNTLSNIRVDSNIANLSFMEMVLMYGDGVMRVGNTHLRPQNASYGVKTSWHKRAHPTWKNNDGKPMPMAFDVTPARGHNFKDLFRVLGKPEWLYWLASQKTPQGKSWGIIDESTWAKIKAQKTGGTGPHVHIGADSAGWGKYVIAMKEHNDIVVNSDFNLVRSMNLTANNQSNIPQNNTIYQKTKVTLYNNPLNLSATTGRTTDWFEPNQDVVNKVVEASKLPTIDAGKHGIWPVAPKDHGYGWCTSGPHTFYKRGIGIGLNHYWWLDSSGHQITAGPKVIDSGLWKIGFKKVWRGTELDIHTLDFKNSIRPGDVVTTYGGTACHAAMCTGIDSNGNPIMKADAPNSRVWVFSKGTGRRGKETVQVWRYAVNPTTTLTTTQTNNSQSNPSNTILINKTKGTLTVNGQTFKVQIGLNGLGQWSKGNLRTPEGEFTIGLRNDASKWTYGKKEATGRDGYRPHAFGDSYFYRLYSKELFGGDGKSSIGIHGSDLWNSPDTFGRKGYGTHGCIAMHNADLRKLNQIIESNGGFKNFKVKIVRAKLGGRLEKLFNLN